MNTHLLDYTLKEIFLLNKKNKMDAIGLLIDSISDDKVYEAEAFRETELENGARRLVKINGKVINSGRVDNKI